MSEGPYENPARSCATLVPFIISFHLISSPRLPQVSLFVSNDPSIGLYGTAQLKARNLYTASIISQLAGSAADNILAFVAPFNFDSLTVGRSGALQSGSPVKVEFDGVPNFTPTSNTPAPITMVSTTTGWAARATLQFYLLF